MTLLSLLLPVHLVGITLCCSARLKSTCPHLCTQHQSIAALAGGLTVAVPPVPRPWPQRSGGQPAETGNDRRWLGGLWCSAEYCGHPDRSPNTHRHTYATYIYVLPVHYIERNTCIHSEACDSVFIAAGFWHCDTNVPLACFLNVICVCWAHMHCACMCVCVCMCVGACVYGP